MKRILFIVMSWGLLLVPIGCMGNKSIQTSATADAVVVESSQQQSSPEQRTEENFYRFVNEVKEHSASKSAETLVCTEYPRESRAFNQILNMIDPASERVKFSKYNKYETEYLQIEYIDKDVKGGFSKLTVRFKNRKTPNKFTITFSPRK